MLSRSSATAPWLCGASARLDCTRVADMATPRSIVIPVARFTRAGGVRVLCRLATEWRHRGIDVSFLVLDGVSRPTFETAGRLIYCHELDARLGTAAPGLLAPLREIRSPALGLRRVRDQFDVVLASHAFTALSCCLAGASSKTVYYVQGYDPEVLAAKSTAKGRVAALVALASYWACRNQVVIYQPYI